MATKNVYVSEGDLGLFDAAAEFAGSLSAAVVAGLRLYVAQQQKTRERTQMSEIEVDVQDGPVIVTRRFTGRRILRYEKHDGPRVTTFRVYLTARDQIAVHIRNDPDWSRLSSSGGKDPIWEDPGTWGTAWWSTTERELRVFPGVDEAEGELPDEVVAAVRQALVEPAVQELDI